MPTAHCVSTIDGVILAVDRGFLDLVRRTEREVVGASYRDITHPTDLDKSDRMLAALVDRAPPVRLRKRYLRPDGSAMTANLFVTRFTDPDRLVSTLFWNEVRGVPSPAKLWEAAQWVRHVHAVRRAEFGSDLATDPVGSLLTAIYLAEAEGRVIGIDQLAAETGMTAHMAGRWIDVLRQRRIVQDDPGDSATLQLTQDGILRMERSLASVYHAPTPMPDLL